MLIVVDNPEPYDRSGLRAQSHLLAQTLHEAGPILPAAGLPSPYADDGRGGGGRNPNPKTRLLCANGHGATSVINGWVTCTRCGTPIAKAGK